MHLQRGAVRLRGVTTQLSLSLDLARRIELAEAQAAVACAETSDGTPVDGRAVMSIAGGFAVYCGPNSPITQAVGLGLSGPVSEQEFERLEQFYRSRQEPVRVEICPLADVSLIEQFGGNGYRVTEFSNVMARSLADWNDCRDQSAVEDVVIEKVGEKQMEIWTLTVAQGFSDNFPVTQEILNVMKTFGSGPAVTCFLARIGGASAGCDLAACLTRPASGSQRNVIRENFTVLYTRVKFERAWS